MGIPKRSPSPRRNVRSSVGEHVEDHDVCRLETIAGFSGSGVVVDVDGMMWG